MGLRDLLPQMAATLKSGLTTTSQAGGQGSTLTLADVRILGSTDPTYGAVGWVPELTGQPFLVIETNGVSDNETTQNNRVWATYHVNLFIAVEHSDTPAVIENYNDLALGWLESARLFVAANRLLQPASTSLYPIAGDVQWVMRGAKMDPKFPIYGIDYYGPLIHTTVRLVTTVNYQIG